jgi:hypothetical protein
VTIKNSPGTDVLAQRLDRRSVVAIQTKTAAPGSAFRLKKKDEEPGERDHEWYVLVSLGGLEERPSFYVLPRHVLAALVFLEHQDWLKSVGKLHPVAKPGKVRPENDQRKIKPGWISGYVEHWDLLDESAWEVLFLGAPIFLELADEVPLPSSYRPLKVAESSVPATGGFTRHSLAGAGFDGFLTFEELRGRLAEVPTEGGVYIVLREAEGPGQFLEQNPGGRFKQRDPSVAAEVLLAKWVDDCQGVYIGKGDNIRRRLKQYADFGAGKPIGHWGGRYIWQLADSDELVVAWKACRSEETAAEMEAGLLRRFKKEHGGRLPFANISDPTNRS